ncbi:hypothetical protein BJV82DRAFT_519530, partial [Fennellomyces sp. T-0311]
PPQSSRNPSSLLSPWWSAEPLPERPAEQNKKSRRTFINFTRIANAIEYGADAPSDCRMVCFLRESEERRKERQDKAKSLWNPFHGLWIVVATTHQRCLEHTAGIYSKWSSRICSSALTAKRIVSKTFAPLQELTRRYVQSWQDGTQQLFFQRFWESTKRGDAFHLVRDNTKKVFQSLTGTEKKPEDDDRKKGSNE